MKKTKSLICVAAAVYTAVSLALTGCGGYHNEGSIVMPTTEGPSTEATSEVTTTAAETTQETTTMAMEKYLVSVPEGSEVTVNGSVISKDDIQGKALPSVVEYAAKFVEDVPVNTNYIVNAEASKEPEVKGKDANGNELIFEKGDHSFIASTKAPADFIEDVEGIVEAGLKAYALYFPYQGDNLKPYILYDSELYGQIFGSADYNWINVTFYNYEHVVDYSFSEFEADDYRIYGDDCFTVHVKYQLDMEFDDPNRHDNYQRLDATWVWVRDEGSWSIADQIYVERHEEFRQMDGIEISTINEKTFYGTLMVIKDPSKVFAGVIDGLGGATGLNLPYVIEEYNDRGDKIVGGVNGGDFVDTGSYIYTGTPLGAVISEGDVVYADAGYGSNYRVVGMTKDNKLVIGSYTVDEMLDMGMRDAIHCESDSGPFLVENGALYHDIPDPSEYGAGKNNRTAIGQREDGAIILLAVNGRQSDSLGATFVDLAETMLKYGAVTAAAMDGGSSSQMAYETSDGVFQYVNHPYTPAYGPRACPTFWLIRK